MRRNFTISARLIARCGSASTVPSIECTTKARAQRLEIVLPAGFQTGGIDAVEIAQEDARTPGRPHERPWSFRVHLYGLRHVVVDADRRYMVSGVPIGSGPLLAAGPELLAALERIAESAPPQTEAHNVAVDALERFREREAMIVADWTPGEGVPRRPQLRVVGVAT